MVQTTPFYEPLNLMRFMMLMNDDVKPVSSEYNFVLVAATIEPAWQCVICKEDGGIAVMHPNNCHAYHKHCLNQALHNDIRCSLCRACVTPLQMIKND